MAKVITHENMSPLLEQLAAEPYFRPGSRVARRPAWVDQPVTLEFPLGELAVDWLRTLSLTGGRLFATEPLDGSEGFDAQGLEGKVQVERDLFGALLCLRDVLPRRRGRIVMEEG